MIVYATVYQKFYEILQRTYYDRVIAPFPERVPENGINSPEIWMKTNGKGRELIRDLFIGSSNNPKYFWRVAMDMDPEFVIKANVTNDLGLAKALEYIGIEPPKGIEKFDKQSPKVQAEILMGVFQKQYFSDTKNLIAPYGVLLNKNISAAKEVLDKYFHHVSLCETDKAWALIAPEFQSKSPWYGNYERYRVAFTNNIARRNFTLFNFSQHGENLITCLAYYESEADVYHSPKLSSMDTITVGDINVFVQNIKDLRLILEENGVEGFEKFQLQKLFAPDATERIWYQCNYDPAKLKDIFYNAKSVITKRLYSYSCKLYDGQWLINYFEGLNVFSAR